MDYICDKIKKEREKAKKLEQDNNRKGNKIKELEQKNQEYYEEIQKLI